MTEFLPNLQIKYSVEMEYMELPRVHIYTGECNNESYKTNDPPNQISSHVISVQ
jgi:hypothetical protein